MPTAIVVLDERANRVINIVKAKYGLNDKSAAINKMAQEYGEEVLEPELKPEYIEKLRRIEKEKTVKIKDLDGYFDALRKR